MIANKNMNINMNAAANRLTKQFFIECAGR